VVQPRQYWVSDNITLSLRDISFWHFLSNSLIACGGHVKIDKGPFKTETDVHKVEYETMGVFGANLLNENLEALIKINDICNRCGIDTISTGGLCIFGFSVLDYQTLPDFLEAADGSNWNMEELEKIGHRISMLRHIFNLKAGINPKDFKFPARVLGNPPLQSGETKGVSIDLEAMLKGYLKEAGFDTETAIPGKEVLAELDLSKYF